MAELYFKVNADYQEVIKLRQECEKLESQIKKTQDAGEKQTLTRTLEKMRFTLGGIVNNAAKAGASLAQVAKSSGTKALNDYANAVQSLFKRYSGLSDMMTRTDLLGNLNKHIYRNKAAIKEHEETISQWYRKMNEAFSSGDMGSVDILNGKIANLSTTVGKLVDDTNMLKSVYDSIQGKGNATMYFANEEDYNRAKALREQVMALKAEFDDLYDTDPEKEALGKQLMESEKELSTLEESAKGAAESLGASLGEKASQATSSLYELNASILSQEESLARLTDEMAEAKKHLDKLVSTPGTDLEEITVAKDKYEQLKAEIERTNDSLHGMKAAQKDAQEEVNTLKGGIADLGDSMNEAGSGADNLLKKLLSFGGITLSVGALKSFGQSIMSTRERFEDMQSTMSTFLKSEEKGAQFFNQLKDYAWFNMDSFENLTAASEQLIAYGNNVDDLITIIDQLSNVASATHKPLMQYVELFNKAKSLGVVDAKSMQSWKAAGFMITDILKEAGEEVSGTSVSFAQLQKALKLATDEGGFFNGVMDNMLQNTSALKGQLEDDITNMQNEIGEGLQGTYNDLIMLADKLVSNYKDVGKVLASLIGIYGTYKAALLTVATIQKVLAAGGFANVAAESAFARSLAIERMELRKNNTVKEKAILLQMKLNAALLSNPWAIVAMSIAAVLGGIAIYQSTLFTVEKAQKQVNSAVEEANSNATSEISLLKKLQYELEKTKEGSVEYNRTREKIISLYGQYDSNLSKEADMVDYLKKHYDDLRDSIIAANKEKVYDSYIRDLEDRQWQKDNKDIGRIQKVLDRQMGENAGVGGVKIAEYLASDNASLIADLRGERRKLLDETIANTVSNGYGQFAIDSEKQKQIDAQLAENATRMNEASKSLESLMNELQKSGLVNVGRVEGLIFDILDRQYVNTQAKDYASSMLNGQQKDIEEAISGIEDPEVIERLKGELERAMTGYIDGVFPKVNNIGFNGMYPTFSSRMEMQGAMNALNKREAELTQSSGPREISDSAYQRRLNNEKNAKDIKKLVRQNEYDIEQARIDAMEEGLGKTLAAENLSHKKRLDAIRTEADERLKALQDQEMQVWLKSDSNRKAKNFVSSIKELPKEWKDVYDEMERLANAQHNKKVIDEILPYKTVEAQRASLVSAIDRQIDEIAKLGDARAEAIAKAMKEVTLAQFDEKNLIGASRDQIKKVKKSLMDAQEKEFATRNPQDKEGLARLQAQNLAELTAWEYEQNEAFGRQSNVLALLNKKWDAYIDTLEDYDKTRARLAKEKDLTDWAKNYASEGSNEELTLFANQLDKETLDDLVVSMSLLENELEFVKDAIGEDNEYASELTAKLILLKAAIKDIRLNGDKGTEPGDDAIKKWSSLVTIIQAASDNLKDLGETIGGSFGETVSIIGSVTSSIGQTVVAVGNLNAQIKEARDKGEKMDIGSMFSGLSSIMGAVLSVTMAIKNARDKWDEEEKQVEDAMKSYHQSIIMSMKGIQGEYDSIFGSDNLAKMHEFYEDWTYYQGKVEEAQKRIRNFSYVGSAIMQEWGYLEEASKMTESLSMSDALVTTRKKRFFGLVGPKQSTLGELYPELFNEDGTVNKNNLEAVIKAIEDMGIESNNALLKELYNLREYFSATEDALENLKGMVSDIFGNLSSEIGDGIINAIRNGSNAMDSLENAGLSVIDSLERQMVNSLLLKYFEQYEDRILEAAGTGDEGALMEVFDEMLDGASGVVEAAKTGVEMLDNRAKELGWDTDKLSEAYQQQASAGAFTSMSQDDASELNGRFTAIQMSNESIRGFVETLCVNVFAIGDSMNKTRMIAEDSRDLQAQALLELQSIRENTSVVLKPVKEMRGLVEDIKKVINDRL